MKNFKKLIAGLSAAAMAMTVGVSAFAAQTGKATASYENGYVRLSNTSDIIDISGTKQWTVVIIPKEKQLSTLSNSDLLYINQGTNVETFWTGTTTTNADSTTTVSGGMGVKGGTLPDGDYIIRIGGETITDANSLIEIALNVSTTSGETTIKVQLGDTNDDTTVNVSDISPIIQHILGSTTLTGKLAIAADTNVDKAINVSDISPIIQHILGSSTLGTVDYTPAE